MNEPLTQTIREGYRNWRNNLILGAPQLMGIFLSIVIFMAACIAAGVLFGLQNASWNFGERPNLAILIMPAMSLLVGFILILFTLSYFCAAGIGMSIKAIENGKTELRDMFTYGNRNVMSIFISILLLIIASIIVLVILFAPAAIACSMRLWGPGIGLALAGGILYMIYLAVLMFFYLMTPAAIVVKNLDAIEGIKEGFRFALKNKLRVFLFLGFCTFISQLFGSLFSIVTGPLNLIGIILPPVLLILLIGLAFVNLILVSSIIVPLAYVYLTRIYLSTNVGIKKTFSKPYEPAVSRAQSSTPRELYI